MYWHLYLSDWHLIGKELAAVNSVKNFLLQWALSSVKLRMGSATCLKKQLSPFKTMFDGSCQECSGPWDLYSSWGSSNALEKASVKCAGLHVRHIGWQLALHDICSFTWYKLRNTKRINRRRRRHLHHHQFRDIEQDYSSSGDNELWDNYRNLNVSRKRKSLSRRRKDRVQRSVNRRHGTLSHHHCHVRLKSRSMSVRITGRSQRLKSSRRVKISKVTNV